MSSDPSFERKLKGVRKRNKTTESLIQEEGIVIFFLESVFLSHYVEVFFWSQSRPTCPMSSTIVRLPLAPPFSKSPSICAI